MDEDEDFLAEVEWLLQWKLAPEEQVVALEHRARGESTAAVADWFNALETARARVNDPAVPLSGPPPRPEDRDPRQFAPPRSGQARRRIN